MMIRDSGLIYWATLYMLCLLRGLIMLLINMLWCFHITKYFKASKNSPTSFLCNLSLGQTEQYKDIEEGW